MCCNFFAVAAYFSHHFRESTRIERLCARILSLSQRGMDVGSKRAAAEAGLAPSSLAAPQRVAVGSSEFNEHFLRFFYCACSHIFCSAPCSSTPPLSRAFCHPIRRCGFPACHPLPP
jgi:hypothetical protein